MKIIQPGNCPNCKRLWGIISGRNEYKQGFMDGIIVKDTVLEALKAARDLFKLMVVDESEVERVVSCVRHLETAIVQAEGQHS